MEREQIVVLISRNKSGGEKRTEVIAEVKSPYQSEFFAASQTDLKPQYKISVWPDEYNDERIVEIGGKKLSVYRTYAPPNQKVEIYVSEKAGLR